MFEDQGIQTGLKWSSSTQGHLLGAFFYGFCLTQLAGGVISERFGGKYPFGLGIGLAAVLTLLYPMAAKTNVILFGVLRGLQGFSEGFAVPAFYILATKWIPEKDKSTLMAIIFSGMNLMIAGVIYECNLLWNVFRECVFQLEGFIILASFAVNERDATFGGMKNVI